MDIKTTRVTLTPALRAFVERKMAMLATHLAPLDKEGAVRLRVEIGKPSSHHRKGEVFYAEANLTLGKSMIRATHEDVTIQNAVTKVKNILKERIAKYRQTQKS